MITKNYKADQDGKHIASGPGVATISTDSKLTWAVGNSSSIAPSLRVKHTLNYGDKDSMELQEGEELWIFGVGIAAVTAELPSEGDI